MVSLSNHEELINNPAPEPDEGALTQCKMKVYILKCSDGSYYTGVTGNLEKRLKQHEEGAFPYCYTFDKRPIQLKFYREFDDNMKAISFEKQVKGWSRAKKEALINGDIAKLKELSKSKKQISSNASSSSAS